MALQPTLGSNEFLLVWPFSGRPIEFDDAYGSLPLVRSNRGFIGYGHLEGTKKVAK